ncbi:MAG: bifunctional demethylmenaquinone methyltransferase/2-methoxy-6-polyprenyl-1,4-benzoquinol methylase UbiE [Bacteroidia bacterium]
MNPSLPSITPYPGQSGTKKEQVSDMFDAISERYDLLNRVLSLGIDIQWRKRVLKRLRPHAPQRILDVATGTGDLAIGLLQLNPKEVVGLDLSPGMLAQAGHKIKRKGLTARIQLIEGDSEELPFAQDYFDAVTVAFGVRNFEHLEQGLSEMARVLKKGGVVAILEFSRSRVPLVAPIFQLYFQYILPTLGRWVSRDASAYTYLPASVAAFPEGEEFLRILQKSGFCETRQERLTFGICTLYTARKQ